MACVLALTACATPPSEPAERAEFEKTNDPLEPLNRKIFDFNLFLDHNLIKPVAEGYRDLLPEFSRNAIRHFLDNLGEPLVFINDVAQGEFSRAHTTFARFLFNSTFGFAGFVDRATEIGLEKQSGDFGQTLYRWGTPDGPYLVLPLLGPSNPRDTVGTVIDGFVDPFSYAEDFGTRTAGLSRFTMKGIDERERNIASLDDLERNAIDFYAELRSIARQHRARELRHGEPAPFFDLERSPAEEPLLPENR